jgi:predicted acylesterase/phospholipase RssA
MNKKTTPNLPVWAAIIASVSLPFLYPYFAANQ